MTTLTVSHNIFLSRQQRYALYEGKKVRVIGVSVPVWLKKSITSEPAVEIFVKYELSTVEGTVFIKHSKCGYIIKMPKNPAQEGDPSLTGLLDIKDGGSCWLAFRQYSKIKRENKTLDLIHYVEIQDLDELLQTIA